MYKLIGLTLLVATVSALTTIEPTTAMGGRIWKCESKISKYTDTECEKNTNKTGCYYVDGLEQYKSCAVICNGVKEHSIDEERCNDQYCPDYLSQDGNCTPVHEVDTTTTANYTVDTTTTDGSVIGSSSSVVTGLVTGFVCLMIGAGLGVGGTYFYFKSKGQSQKLPPAANAGAQVVNENDDVDAPPPNAGLELANLVGAAEPAAGEPVIYQPDDYSKEETNQPEGSAGDENDINQANEGDPLIPVRPSGLPLYSDSAAQEETVNYGTLEFRRVKVKFHETCTTPGIKITEIVRIQNEYLYVKYKNRKSDVKKELADDPSIVVERQLWRGTAAKSIQEILDTRSNRSDGADSNKIFGQETPFSTTSQYCLDEYVGQGDQYIILEKVVTGRCEEGSKTYLRQDCHSTFKKPDDKTVLFNVHHMDAAYPEYVIKFQRLDQDTNL